MLTIEDKRGTFVHPDFQKRGFGTWLNTSLQPNSRRLQCGDFRRCETGFVTHVPDSRIQIIGTIEAEYGRLWTTE